MLKENEHNIICHVTYVMITLTLLSPGLYNFVQAVTKIEIKSEIFKIFLFILFDFLSLDFSYYTLNSYYRKNHRNILINSLNFYDFLKSLKNTYEIVF